MIAVPRGVLGDTFGVFRRCGRRSAECVAYWVGPADAADRVDEVVHPVHSADRHGYTDLYGNDCQRLNLPVGDTTLRYDAVVTVPDATEDVDLDAAEVPAAQLPDDVLVYTLPSRYCLPDVLGDEV